VSAVAWTAAGDRLAVSTTIRDGDGRIRVLRWPDLAVVTDARTVPEAVDIATIDESGAVYWIGTEPDVLEGSSFLWRLPEGGSLGTLNRVTEVASAVGLIWTERGFVTSQFRFTSVEESRVALIDLVDPGAEAIGLTAWSSRPWSSVWVDSGGQWLVRSVGHDDEQEFIVANGVDEWRIQPPGYGGRELSLTPDRAAIVYQRSETARLTLLDYRRNVILGELSDREFWAGSVSSTGILAGATPDGALCIVDVNDKLVPAVPSNATE
jgi:hypothetical protein